VGERDHISVCVSLYQLFNQSVDLYEIQKRGYAIKGDLSAIISNPVASTNPKLLTSKLLSWMQNFHQSTWNHETLYADRSSEDEQLLIRRVLRKTKHTNMLVV
jgi:glycogen debranching enzyme